MTQDTLLGSSRWRDKYPQQGLESPPVHWESVTPHAGTNYLGYVK